MKLIPILACAAIAVFVLPACAAKKETKASCCSTTGKCDTAVKKHHH